ncbi:zinc-binding dehydrogenase [Streptomyces sp. NPDC059717]|uniref:zinc-binding dehydrogenase n=1 Tax=Streptomyces sp. NPDC059717 TaxID=3346922 RepID=UPI0036BD76E9
MLVHGAAGGVGSLAVQIALSRGARVIGTASERDHEYLRALGAEPVTYGCGVGDHVRELVPNGADAVLDTYGHGVLTAAARAAAHDARVASIADAGLTDVLRVFCRMDNADLGALVELAEADRLHVRIGATYPLERAADAQRALAAGDVAGKIVITIG